VRHTRPGSNPGAGVCRGAAFGVRVRLEICSSFKGLLGSIPGRGETFIKVVGQVMFMDIEELDIDIKMEITSIRDLRKVRQELQKIAKAKKEIEYTEDDEDGRFDPPDRDMPDPVPDPEFSEFSDDIFCTKMNDGLGASMKDDIGQLIEDSVSEESDDLENLRGRSSRGGFNYE